MPDTVAGLQQPGTNDEGEMAESNPSDSRPAARKDEPMKPFALIVMLAVLVSGPTGLSAQAPARTAITVAPIASTDMATLYYAVQQGWFEKAGLDVTIQQAPTGAAAMTAVVGGAAQIGYTNTLALTTAHGKGIPVTLLSAGAQYRTAIPHAVLLVASDSQLKTAKDLEGHVVAVAGLHDLLGVSTATWIEKNGGDPSKVKFVEIPPATMQAALESKRVDAAAIYEPFLSAATRAGTAKVFAKPYDAIALSFLTGAWFGLAPWISQHRDAAITFARVLDQAATYVNAHYDDLVPLLVTVTKLPPETLHNMVKVYVPPKLDPSTLQPVVDVAAKAHEIAASFRAADMVLPGVP
jgi:NitT/TauT family transport system substrate-binding protein